MTVLLLVLATSELLLLAGYTRRPEAAPRPPVDGDQAARPTPETHVYKSVGGVDLVADVYIPDDAGPRPVVVWLHGGALIFGNRGWVRDDFVDFCRREGLVLVSLDYRLAPETKLPEILTDIRDGLRWVRERGPELFAADAERIAVAGNSAGGYLALMAGGTAQPAPRAVLSYWGYGAVDGEWYTTPHYLDGDLIALTEEAVRDPRGRLIRDLYYVYLRQQGTWTLEVTGLDPESRSAELERFNPIRLVSPGFPPTLLVHGLQDDDVPAAESVSMAAALEAEGVEVELILVPGAGHELQGASASEIAEAHRRAERFLLRHLEPAR